MRLILISILLLTCSVIAQTPEFYIVPGERIGPVTRQSTKSSLIQALGRSHVRDTQISLGEGETANGAVLYPNYPLEIIWKSGPSASATPQSVWLRGESSVWRTRDGIGLGTGLARAEKVNGGPFKLAGFGWDYEGNVGTWNGQLSEVFKALSVRFTLSQDHYEFYGHKALQAVIGDVLMLSDHPLFLKLVPNIHEMVLTFESLQALLG